jgi:glycosyltransferase involved in cell wall biosynthesis
VVSGIGGNSDLITDHQTGRLVAEATPQAWASTVLELLRNPDEAKLLGAAARRRIDEHFSLAAVVERYLDLYRAMVDGRWPA